MIFYQYPSHNCYLIFLFFLYLLHICKEKVMYLLKNYQNAFTLSMMRNKQKFKPPHHFSVSVAFHPSFVHIFFLNCDIWNFDAVSDNPTLPLLFKQLILHYAKPYLDSCKFSVLMATKRFRWKYDFVTGNFQVRFRSKFIFYSPASVFPWTVHTLCVGKYNTGLKAAKGYKWNKKPFWYLSIQCVSFLILSCGGLITLMYQRILLKRCY